MRTSSKTSTDRLFQIASEQQGYFTTMQAIIAGFQDATHPYHVRCGDWVREWRGIYRIARYPRTETGQYALWALWAWNRKGVPQGIYSHETALSLHELSDIMPDKLHITVPPPFRRHSEIPGILVLHRGIVAPEEIEEREGYAVMKPVRAIIDLIADDSVSVDIVRQAFKEAKQRGMVRNADIQRYLVDVKMYRKIRDVLGELV